MTRTTGASFEFAHDTIGDYYKHNGELELRSYSHTRNGLIVIVVGLVVLSLYLMLSRRYWDDFYWRNSNGFTIVPSTQDVKLLSDSTVIVNKNGKLTVTVQGEVYLGTFIGYVGPGGTEAGFIGFR